MRLVEVLVDWWGREDHHPRRQQGVVRPGRHGRPRPSPRPGRPPNRCQRRIDRGFVGHRGSADTVSNSRYRWQEAGMPSGAPTDRPGYLHEAVLYDSDEEFLGVVVPFLQEGVAAG